MVPGSSMLSAHVNVIPGSRRWGTYRIRGARKRLLLPIVDNRDAVRHEVEDHGVTEVKEKSLLHDHDESQGQRDAL